jgi:hypothetical protein
MDWMTSLLIGTLVVVVLSGIFIGGSIAMWFYDRYKFRREFPFDRAKPAKNARRDAELRMKKARDEAFGRHPYQGPFRWRMR